MCIIFSFKFPNDDNTTVNSKDGEAKHLYEGWVFALEARRQKKGPPMLPLWLEGVSPTRDHRTPRVAPNNSCGHGLPPDP